MKFICRTLWALAGLGLLLNMDLRAQQQAPATAQQTAAATQEPAPATTQPPAAAPGQPVIPSSGVDTQEVHILSGRSVIINLQSRLRRILVSNPGVIHTETTSPTQLVMVAVTPGSSSVIIWDETGHSRILDVYSDVDVASLRAALQQAYPNESIEVTADQSNIMISGVVPGRAEADDIGKIASSYSKQVVNSLTVAERHGKQVLLAVKIAEIDRTKLEQFGINIFSTGAANTVGSVTTQQFTPPTLLSTGVGGGQTTTFNVGNLLNIFLFRPDINLGATVQALQQKNILQILAEPNLMAMNGQPAKFLAGGEFPFPVVQPGQGFTAVTIQFRPFGVQLNFTANIENDDVVRLKVNPEVSALDFTNALTISGFTVPAISTRRAESEIELKSGQSFGIAGMMDHRTTVLLSKVPGIGDIPVLGRFFRSRSVTNSNTELMVLVTPTIVDPVGAAMAPAKPPIYPLPMLDTPKFDESVKSKSKNSNNTSPDTNPK
jgi:pilus assembly protein CpaC